MISLIVCMDNQNVIGKDGKMPWHIPSDLAHFKRITDGGIVIMGRKTYESLPKLLSNREHVVISSSLEWAFPNIEDALSYSRKRNKEIFIIGGATIYEQFLPYADRLYVTRVNHTFEGDTYFPEIDYSEWNPILSSIKSEMDNGYELFFVTYERNK